MKAPGWALLAALAFGAGAACGAPPEPAEGVGNADIRADTVDSSRPGTILRYGPADPEVVSGPVYPPVVVGDEGQVSVYEGFFIQEPCALPLRVDASRQSDTILVRVISEPDTARVDCRESERPAAYAVLVGQFEPGAYSVRVVHEGDRARTTPLDIVYDNIAIRPNPR